MNATEITQIIIAVLTVIMPPLVGGIIVIARSRFAQLPQAQRAQLESVAALVVKAVEQGSSQVSSPEKKAFAVAQIKNIAKNLGMTVDDQSASSFIEAAVYELNQTRQVAKIAWLNTPNQSNPPEGGTDPSVPVA